MGDVALEELTETSHYAGSYRRLLARPEDCTIDFEGAGDDDLQVRVSFSLPKSCYATIVLRELLRVK